MQLPRKDFLFRFLYIFPVRRLLKKAQLVLLNTKFRFRAVLKFCALKMLRCRFRRLICLKEFFRQPERSQCEILVFFFRCRIFLEVLRFRKQAEWLQFHC